jgi:menaquinone-dependent protoporphyrinogen oxidase
MRVLVAYATRHGATAGIAERVAAALTAAGLSAEARPVEEVKDVEPTTRSSSAVRPTCSTG